jgi:hypothetical protein
VGTLGGCTCEAPQDRAGSNVPESCAYDAPLFAPVQTDILFVVDDSNSMSEEQEGVARELPTFVQVLQTGAGVQQNLRVGLVNTSVYSAFFGNQLLLTKYPQGGWLRQFPAADAGVGGGERWLTDPDPEIVPRLSAAIRALGINGSFQENALRGGSHRAHRDGLLDLAARRREPERGLPSGTARACWSWR